MTRVPHWSHPKRPTRGHPNVRDKLRDTKGLGKHACWFQHVNGFKVTSCLPSCRPLSTCAAGLSLPLLSLVSPPGPFPGHALSPSAPGARSLPRSRARSLSRFPSFDNGSYLAALHKLLANRLQLAVPVASRRDPRTHPRTHRVRTRAHTH